MIPSSSSQPSQGINAMIVVGDVPPDEVKNVKKEIGKTSPNLTWVKECKVIEDDWGSIENRIDCVFYLTLLGAPGAGRPELANSLSELSQRNIPRERSAVVFVVPTSLDLPLSTYLKTYAYVFVEDATHHHESAIAVVAPDSSKVDEVEKMFNGVRTERENKALMPIWVTERGEAFEKAAPPKENKIQKNKRRQKDFNEWKAEYLARTGTPSTIVASSKTAPVSPPPVKEKEVKKEQEPISPAAPKSMPAEIEKNIEASPSVRGRMQAFPKASAKRVSSVAKEAASQVKKEPEAAVQIPSESSSAAVKKFTFSDLKAAWEIERKQAFEKATPPGETKEQRSERWFADFNKWKPGYIAKQGSAPQAARVQTVSSKGKEIESSHVEPQKVDVSIKNKEAELKKVGTAIDKLLEEMEKIALHAESSNDKEFQACKEKLAKLVSQYEAIEDSMKTKQ